MKSSNLAIAVAVGALTISAAGCASHPQTAANTQPVQASVAPSSALRPAPTPRSGTVAPINVRFWEHYGSGEARSGGLRRGDRKPM